MQAYSSGLRQRELKEVFVVKTTTDEESEKDIKDENQAFNKEKVKEIVVFWLLTVPVAMTFSYLITKVLLML